MPQPLAHQVWTALAGQADPARAEGEKRYLNSDIEHLGVPVPAVRKAVSAIRKEHPALGHDDVVDLVRQLWSEPVHECRLAAALRLKAYGDRLEAADAKLLEELIRDARTWALVDVLAGDAGGHLLLRHPEVEATYRRWGRDEDMWVRRSGILGFLVPLRDREKHDRFFGVFTEIADGCARTPPHRSPRRPCQSHRAGHGGPEAMQQGRESFAELLFGALTRADLTRFTNTLEQIAAVLESTGVDAPDRESGSGRGVDLRDRLA